MEKIVPTHLLLPLWLWRLGCGRCRNSAQQDRDTSFDAVYAFESSINRKCHTGLEWRAFPHNRETSVEGFCCLSHVCGFWFDGKPSARRYDPVAPDRTICDELEMIDLGNRKSLSQILFRGRSADRATRNDGKMRNSRFEQGSAGIALVDFAHLRDASGK